MMNEREREKALNRMVGQKVIHASFICANVPNYGGTYRIEVEDGTVYHIFGDGGDETTTVSMEVVK